MTKKKTNPDSSLLQLLIERDHPPIVVKHIDNHPDRLISLPASEAVLWCYASDMGEERHRFRFRSYLMFADGFWMCGPYRARNKEERHDT